MLGLVQSPPDNRDWNYAAIKAGSPLPPAFSYPDTPLRDQGPYGTCVGFGSANLKDAQELRDSRMVASALYVYRSAKAIDGLPEGTEGTTLKAALTVLKDKGVCSEKDYPYRLITESHVEPSMTLEEIAKGKIAGYARCYTAEDIKQALFKEGPVLIGVAVTDNFRNLGKGTHNVTTLFGGYVLGGHCLTIKGFDDNRASGGKKGFFRVKNSWSDWGEEGGYFWLAYDCVTERSDLGMSLFMEAWSTVDVRTGYTGTAIDMWVGHDKALVNGQSVVLDSPPKIVNNRTLVPVRFIAEALGFTVQWDPTTQKVTLTKGV